MGPVQALGADRSHPVLGEGVGPGSPERSVDRTSRTFYEAYEISNFCEVHLILQKPIDDHLLSIQTAVPLISQSRDRPAQVP
jgi:hypothetical protein